MSETLTHGISLDLTLTATPRSSSGDVLAPVDGIEVGRHRPVTASRWLV
jgi:hypothetical protein